MIELFVRKNSKKVPKGTKKEINSLIPMPINDNENENYDDNYNIVNNNFSPINYSISDHKKCHIPFIIYILIFTFILFIVSIALLIWTYNNKEIYYTFERDIYVKPNISEHNYSKITFNNGLQVVLTQVHISMTLRGGLYPSRGGTWTKNMNLVF